MSWLQVHLLTGRAQAGEIEAALEGLGALAVSLEDAGDEPVLEPDPGSAPLWSHTKVTGLFPGEMDEVALHDQVLHGIPPGLLHGLAIERLQDQAWERAWLDAFHPMRFGERLWVCPTGQRPEQADAVVVDLDPGLAFGTGTHPTTALCLRWLDRHPPRGLRVLDYGCGSGILSIAALRLGAAEVTALDHDPQALEASASNAHKNGVEQRLCLLPVGTSAPGQYDLVLANILAGTLVELAPRITQKVAPGGHLILSGILHEQAEQVMAAYRDHFRLAPPKLQEGWVLLEGRRLAAANAPAAAPPG